MLLKRFFVFVLLLLAISSGVLAENFAAIVNNQVITIADFDKAFDSAKKQLTKQEDVDFSSEEGQILLAATKRSILDEMIDFVLLNQGAEELGVTVNTQEIEERIKKVQTGFPSKAIFSEALLEDGITSTDLQQGIRQELLIEKVTDKLASKVNINDGEISNFFNKNKELFSQPKRVQVFQMLLPTREEAQEIIDKLKKGEDFKKLAKKYSLDQLTSADGGELGFIEESQLPPFLAEVVSKLGKGEISEPVQAAEGFYIIKSGEILDKKEAELNEARKQVKVFLMQERKRNVYERWVEQYKNKATIKINQDLFPKLKDNSVEGAPAKQGNPSS